MAAYDILGNIAIVKFARGTGEKQKKKYAEKLMNINHSVRTVLEKSSKFHGRLRTMKTKFISGEKTKEALYKENGCLFRFNVDSCYFSPRLASDRLEVAKMARKNETVLAMFSGVGVYPIVIAKMGKAGKVIGVEISRECNKYAVENVKRNKLIGKVELAGGDVRKIIGKGKKIGGKFDRIMMARPNLKDSFLDVAFSVIAKGGIIHYHGFYEEDKLDELKELIVNEAKKAGKRIKIIRIKKAGDIGVKKFRYRADFRVLN